MNVITVNAINVSANLKNNKKKYFLIKILDLIFITLKVILNLLDANKLNTKMDYMI